MGGDKEENVIIIIKNKDKTISVELLEKIFEKRMRIISDIAKRNLLLEN